MAHTKTKLLTPTELRDLYGIPVLNDLERQQYFTFNQEELNALNNFRNIKDAVYFAVFLVFFKLKHAVISFQYQDITLERKHVMERYFPNKAYPKSLPSSSTKNRIDLQIIELCNYKYCKASTYKSIQLELQELASYAPRQRQLLKDLLRLLEKHCVIIPGHTTLQNLVIQTSNKEQNRIEKCYLNSTTLKQRKSILALLKTTAETTDIHDVKADLKSFKTHDLWEEIKKHTHLKAIFEVAKIAIQKMGLPLSTCQYYASLVQYYHASRMKRINKRKIGLYLLCYVFIRYQTINDTLIDGFKKRISDIQGKANSFTDEQRLKQLDASQETRQNICNMMLMVKKRRSSKIDKKILYKYIAEAEWEEAAYSLVDENFNKKCLYWQYIDSIEDSIKLSIRPLFLALDFTIIQNDLLKEVMDFMKSKIESSTLITSPFPKTFHKWVDKNQAIHIFQGDEIISNRFEFLMYMKMIQALSKNQISLEHSMRYKNIDDEIMKPQI